MNTVNRNFGWKKDKEDLRDKKFSVKALPLLPKFVDIIGLNNPIEDQGSLGSCTGNSSTSALEIVLNSEPLSRLMAYYNARLLEKNVKNDDGAEIRNVIKGFMKYGVSTETLWPYNIQKFTKKPSIKSRFNAKNIIPKVESYERLDTLFDVKNALAQGLPVVFGFYVPEYFQSQEIASTGILTDPPIDNNFIGGHAVVAVGYNETSNNINEHYIIVRNSWGSNWGLNGYFKMPYSWFTDNRKLVDDMWTIHIRK